MDDNNNNNFSRPRGRGYRGANNGQARGGGQRVLRRGQAKYYASRGRHVSLSPPKREVHFESSKDRGLGLRIRSTGSLRLPGRNIRGGRGGYSSNTYNAKNDPEAQWYRIEIPHGAKSERDYLIRTISASMDNTLTPYNYHLEGNFAIFSVLGKDVADTLSSLNKRITKPDGYKIIINVKPSTAPTITMDENTELMIKNVMGKRYDQNTKFLDLSSFRKDQEFLSKELYIPLDRPNVLKVVSKIVAENIPDLTIINLADNRIRFLEGLSTLCTSCTNIKAMNLSKNMIGNMTELDHLSSLQLIELCLDGNPCINHKDKSSLISSIRSMFPKLVKLDGEDLPPVIGFEVEETTTLPPAGPSYLPPDAEKFATDFVAQFYTIYDSSDRQKLVEGYHEQASFSFSIMKGPGKDYDQSSSVFPRELVEESRNLLKLTSPEIKTKLLRQGRINVVAAINSLPETNHIKESFIVDVPFFSNVLVTIVVNGLFVETWCRRSQTRSFCRTFTIVPQENGFFIINDIFMVGNSTHEQRQKFPAQPSPYTIDRSITSRLSTGDGSLVSQVSNMTGMNNRMSKQLLDECQQDMDKALVMFKELNDRGAIPAEAFMK